jgi:type II/III secretion system protein
VTRHLQTLAFVFALALASTAVASTQEKEKVPPAAPQRALMPTPLNVTPLKVQVVIGRYQGEKKLSSMPYTLTMNANNHANLRMGARIPIVMLAMTNVPKDTPAGGPIQYQDVGTNIDCSSTALDDGRYLLNISVDDSSVYPDDQPSSGGTKGNPSFRSFRAANSMVLRNGETGQFTTATDKVTGETVKVDVTLTVMK